MRVSSVVPFLNFVLTGLSLRLFGRLYATKGALLNISANRSLIEESSNYVLQLPQLMWRGCYM